MFIVCKLIFRFFLNFVFDFYGYFLYWVLLFRFIGVEINSLLYVFRDLVILVLGIYLTEMLL